MADGARENVAHAIPQRWVALAAAFLVLVYACEVFHAIRGQSLTWDEGDHIFAGYEQWKIHDYGLNPEHPPMVKMVATLPLLVLPLRVPANQGRFFKNEAYLDGREMLFENGAAHGGQYEGRDLTLRVRTFAFVFGLCGALVVFACASEMFGSLAGLAALAMFVFDPTILAHSAYVTTDMAASATMLATVYAFWRWTQKPTHPRVMVMGIAAGLALAAKHSTVLLLPMLAALGVVVVLQRVRGRAGLRGSWARESFRVFDVLAGVAAIAVVILWAWYGFRFAARPAGLALSPTLAEYVQPLAPHEAKGILLLAKMHLLPESYLYGLADVRLMANDMPSYFFGHVYAHGIWYYFPALLTIKMTLAMLALIVFCVLAVARGWLRGRVRLLFLTIPPAMYLLVAMTSHLNIGARHVLPLYVFACVLCGATVAALWERSAGWRVAAGVLLLCQVGTSLICSPNYMAYANEAWGGSGQTYRYLSDSNTDWAQQLVAVAEYTREHHITQCWFGYFAAPVLLPSDYGVPCKLLNSADTGFFGVAYDVPPEIDGPVFVSAGSVNGFELGSGALNPFAVFERTKAVDFIQDGVLVYQGHFAVPLDAALGHATLAQTKLAAKDVAGAVAEGEIGERLAPGAPMVELPYGDALAAAGKKDEARAAYERARPVIGTMDADARAKWEGKVAEKEAALK